MSAATATATKAVKAVKSTSTLTEKFSKELTKFFTWAKENDYVIKSAKDSVEQEWSTKLLKKFEEPPRNKLESYIKELLAVYTITKNDEEIEDNKVFAKEFKDNKPKRKVFESTSDSESERTVVVNKELDTSDTYYLDTLEFNTKTLMSKLGKPIKAKGEKNMYEWKVTVNGNVYSIYDWIDENGEFAELENCEWHIGGLSANKTDIKAFIKFMNETSVSVKPPAKKRAKAERSWNPVWRNAIIELQMPVEEQEESDVDSEISNAEATKESCKELFGETFDDLEEEINLDDIDDIDEIDE